MGGERDHEQDRCYHQSYLAARLVTHGSHWSMMAENSLHFGKGFGLCGPISPAWFLHQSCHRKRGEQTQGDVLPPVLSFSYELGPQLRRKESQL